MVGATARRGAERRGARGVVALEARMHDRLHRRAGATSTRRLKTDARCHAGPCLPVHPPHFTHLVW